MRRFLIHLSIFSLVLCLIIAVIATYNGLLAEKEVKLKGHILVLGDSHTVCAIDPAEFPGLVNTAQTAEPLIASYYKLKQFQEDNPALDTVVIQFSYNTLAEYNSYKFSSGSGMQKQIKRLNSIMELRDFGPFPVDTSFYRLQSLKDRFLFPRLGSPDYRGGFKPKEYHLDEVDLSATLARHFYGGDSLQAIAIHNLNYLDSLVDFSRVAGMHPIVITSPLHPAYLKQVPHKFQQNLADKLNSLRARGVWVKDYSEWATEDTLFADYDHLNRQGAAAFTRQLRQDLH